MRIDDLLDHLDALGVETKILSNSIESECPSCETFGSGKFLIRKSDGKTVCFRGSCDYGTKKFDEYYSIVAGISIQEARDIISGQELITDRTSLKLNLDKKERSVIDEELQKIEWPPEGLGNTFDIDGYGGEMGVEYLQSRGIPMEIAKEYGIRFSITKRRVIFPIMIEGEHYGYQARSIDDVEKQYRMLNNPGFQRAKMVMFADRLQKKDYAVITEGPVDAIKFHTVGGNICTMGKKISKSQIDLIKSYGVKSLYLALDDDAISDARWVQTYAEIPCYLVRVPQSAVDRCNSQGKKADFGECTFEEAEKAFKSASLFNRYMTVLNLKG